jgi:DNA ligase-associated metallophosphoesterase
MIMDHCEFQFGESTFKAYAEKILLDSSGTMLVADCHFGKTSHFRKNHIPIPQKAALADFQNLQHCLQKFLPARCIFLGDLFHSVSNHEWGWLRSLLKDNSHIEFLLVEGNHDILPLANYEKAGLPVLENLVLEKNILLSHEPTTKEGYYNICGHIHPGFTVSGKGRQHVSMPCFFVTENQLILPSFGKLTGFVTMNKRAVGGKAICIAGQKIYVVENNQRV